MKLRKLSLGLGVAAATAFAFMLTSCEGSKKVTYTDENGQEQTVTVKKSSNSEEIAESLTAVVYSSANTKFKPNGLGVSASADVKVTATQISNSKKVTIGGSVDAEAKFTFGDYEKNGIDDYCAYASVKASAKVPTALLTMSSSEKINIEDGTTLLAESSTDVDYSVTSSIVAKAQMFADKDAIYLNVSKLNLPYDDVEAIGDYESFINNNIVGKYVKLNEDSLTALSIVPAVSMYSSMVSQYAFNMDKYAKMYYDSYTDDTTFVDTMFKDLTEGHTSAEFKEELLKDLETKNIVISSVDGNKMTLKYGLADKDAKDDEYQGNSYVAVTFDIVNKVPTAAKFDLSDYINYRFESAKDGSPEAQFKDPKATAKGSLKITYSPKVSRISNKNKENADDFSGLIKKIFAAK